MKILVSALMLSLSTGVMANDLIKMIDGGVARCESRVDVVRHNLSSVYRPLSAVRNGEKVTLRLEFLRCVENKRNNTFGFEREPELMVRTVRPLLSPDRELNVVRRDLSVVVMNGKGVKVDKQELKEVGAGVYTVTVKTTAEEYDDSPLGKKSLELHVQSIMKITDADTGEVIDQGLEALGAYRIVVK